MNGNPRIGRDFVVAWCFSTLADDLAAALRAAEDELRLEQAVYGLDAKDEKAIQTLLANKLGDRYQVAREVHYPSSKGKKLSHRLRCDLVLTPRGRPLKPDVMPEQTLFDLPQPGATAVNYCEPSEALWLEVKVAYQFREGGVRHGGYGAQWRQKVVDDLRKMEAEPQIREGGLALIVFNESQEILDKDLELFEDVLALKEVLAGFRQVRTVPILERIGHRLCTAAVWPTIQR
jgi:hypothetical protein